MYEQSSFIILGSKLCLYLIQFDHQAGENNVKDRFKIIDIAFHEKVVNISLMEFLKNEVIIDNEHLKSELIVGYNDGVVKLFQLKNDR